jgi:hypothetical protein
MSIYAAENSSYELQLLEQITRVAKSRRVNKDEHLGFFPLLTTEAAILTVDSAC